MLALYMKQSRVISVFIFMNTRKIQNLCGPRPSHFLELLSLPPSSRFRIWISGSQTLQCPLTPRLSRPLSFIYLISVVHPSLYYLMLAFYHISPYIWTIFFHLSSFFGTTSSLSQVILHFSLILQPLYVFQHVCMMSIDTLCVHVVYKCQWCSSSAVVMSGLRSKQMLLQLFCCWRSSEMGFLESDLGSVPFVPVFTICVITLFPP